MKVLSKERRAEIEDRVKRFAVHVDEANAVMACNIYLRDLVDVLASEAFWREAVKNCEPVEVEGGIFCSFCQCGTRRRIPIAHEPDCPWVLATAAT